MKSTIIATWVALFLVMGCSGSGLGDEVRKDIQTQMDTVRPAITTCYADALKRNRKLQGQMTLAIKTEPDTGKFKEVNVTQNEVQDPALETCVVNQVTALKLQKPTTTAVATDYPIKFAPSN